MDLFWAELVPGALSLKEILDLVEVGFVSEPRSWYLGLSPAVVYHIFRKYLYYTNLYTIGNAQECGLSNTMCSFNLLAMSSLITKGLYIYKVETEFMNHNF